MITSIPLQIISQLNCSNQDHYFADFLKSSVSSVIFWRQYLPSVTVQPATFSGAFLLPSE